LIAIPLLLLLAAPGLQDPAAEKAPPSPCSGAADAGLTLITGNNESTNSAVNATVKYQGTTYRWIFEGNYSGTRQQNQLTGNSFSTSRLYRLAGAYHRFLDDEEKLYLYGKGQGRSDAPNGLDIREDLGVGVGYSWYWNERNSEVSFEGGPSYVKENNVGALVDDYLSGRAEARLDWEFARSIRLLGRSEYIQSFDNTDDRSATGELSLRWSFESSWYLQATLGVAWDNTAAPGFQSTDYRYVLAVGTSF